MLEILRSKRPQAFLFENVKALTTILDREGNLFFDTLKDLIKAAGYDVHAEVLDAAEFGLPQQRNRVYIVGFRKDVELRGEFTFPKPIPLNRCVKDILEEKVDDKYFLKVLWKNRKCGKSTHRESALPDTTRLEALQAAYNGKANNASGIPVNWEDAKKISSPVDKILPVAIIYGDTPSKLPRQTDKLYSAWGISPTIATFSTPPFDTPQGWRILTPRECARLQGFDQSYVFPKSDSIAYRQIGNGVAVNVVQAVMKQLFLALV